MLLGDSSPIRRARDGPTLEPLLTLDARSGSNNRTVAHSPVFSFHIYFFSFITFRFLEQPDGRHREGSNEHPGPSLDSVSKWRL